jgi:chromatin structure-remodeling complex subunit RSC3/30
MTLVVGDSNYRVWRRLGDLSTTVFTLGLHQEIKVSPEVPFWLAEIRKRCLATTYAVDKLMATFVGRPPRISRRYCSIQAPLDIEIADLALSDEELNVKLNQLDPDGWYHDGTMRRSAYMRTFLVISRIREDILEISLGPEAENILEIGQ